MSGSDWFLYVVRWIHIVAGITWIGHLYFFNFVNGNFSKALEADVRKKVVPELMPRALYLFRWGAMFTFVAGVILLYMYGYFPLWGAMFTGQASGPAFSKGMWMLMGAGFGTIMWFNVWFIIWPAQKKIIAGVRGDAPAAPPELAARATLASRINTYLSVPLVWGMMAGAHSIGGHYLALFLILLFGFGAVWVFYRHAAKISTKV